MAEGIYWFKVLAYIFLPLCSVYAIYWGIKKYKKSHNRSEMVQPSDKITNLKHSPSPAGRKKIPDIIGEKNQDGLNGQMELERRRFAG